MRIATLERCLTEGARWMARDIREMANLQFSSNLNEFARRAEEKYARFVRSKLQRFAEDMPVLRPGEEGDGLVFVPVLHLLLLRRLQPTASILSLRCGGKTEKVALVNLLDGALYTAEDGEGAHGDMGRAHVVSRGEKKLELIAAPRTLATRTLSGGDEALNLVEFSFGHLDACIVRDRVALEGAKLFVREAGGQEAAAGDNFALYYAHPGQREALMALWGDGGEKSSF